MYGSNVTLGIILLWDLDIFSLVIQSSLQSKCASFTYETVKAASVWVCFYEDIAVSLWVIVSGGQWVHSGLYGSECVCLSLDM